MTIGSPYCSRYFWAASDGLKLVSAICFSLLCISVSQRIHPCARSPAQNRRGEIGNLEQSINAHCERDNEGWQDHVGIRNRQWPDHPKQAEQDLGKDEQKGGGHHLIKGKAKEGFKPAPKQPIEFGHNQEWHENRSDQDTNCRGHEAVGNDGEGDSLRDC